MRTRLIAAALAGVLAVSAAPAGEPGAGLGAAARAFAKRQVERSFRSMNRPTAPFRIIGNVYYVGASDVSSFLIATPEGHFLLDSGFAETAPQVRENVRTLGFRIEDVKVLLNSHAHIDHAGGHDLIRRWTGARVVTSAADATLMANGGRGDFLPVGDELVAYTPVTTDQTVRDLDRVTLGGVTLTAHLTPGHTRGCTTWTTTVEDGEKRYQVVFFGSTTLVPGVRLTGNPRYPEMAADFARTFRVLKSLPCDVFLAPHGSMYGLEDKARRLAAGASPNPFLDLESYRDYVARSERVFLEQLRRERETTSPTG